MTTISYKDINLDDLTLSSPEKIGDCYMCNLYNDDDLLYIQTPILKVNDIIEENDEKFIDVEINDKLFIDFLLEIENNNIKYTFNNSKKWFNKEIPYDAIDNMYEEQEIFEIDEDDKIKYNMNFKIPIIEDKVQCNVYDENKEIINMDKINSGTNVILLLHFKGLRILKESFCLDCYINQIKIVNIDYFNILEDYSIIDDEDSSNIDETIFSEEINSVLEEEKRKKEEEKGKKEEEKLKKEENEKIKNNIENEIKKLKDELNNLNN